MKVEGVLDNMEEKEVELEVFEIDGKEYAVLYEKDGYIFTRNVADDKDVKVFKSITEDGEEYIEPASEAESDKALALFYLEYRREGKKEE